MQRGRIAIILVLGLAILAAVRLYRQHDWSSPEDARTRAVSVAVESKDAVERTEVRVRAPGRSGDAAPWSVAAPGESHRFQVEVRPAAGEPFLVEARAPRHAPALLELPGLPSLLVIKLGRGARASVEFPGAQPAGATLRLKNERFDFSKELERGANGAWVAELLPPGTYELRVVASDGTPAVSELVLARGTNSWRWGSDGRVAAVRES